MHDLKQHQEPMTIEEQVQNLKGIGLLITDEEYAKKILNDIALVGWTSGGHSGGYVPVFAIGAGAELFQGRIDNTEIPVKIAEAAGYPN